MHTTQPAARRGQIFISYSRRNTPGVGRLYNELKRARYNLWMDTTETGIQIGSNWRQSLKDNMNLSAAVIACLSPDFLQSEYCKAEIAQALEENKPIYPMLFEPLNPGDELLLEAFGLKDIQYGDLTKPDSWDPSMRKLRRKLPPPDWLGYLTRYGGYAAAALLTVLVLFVALRAAPVEFLGQTFGFTPPEPTPTPAILEARLGVAVTYFALDEGIDEAHARSLIDRFAGDMRQAVQAASLRTELAIGFLSPSQLNAKPVEGTTPTERRDSARQYTSGRGVDMVIYGHIRRGENGLLNIYPEFTLIPEELMGAAELAEGNRFGRMIVAPERGATTEAERDLSRRAESAAEIAAGLAQLATRERREFEKAVETFQGVIDDYPADEISAVAYVLLGNAHLRTAEYIWRQCDAERLGLELEAAIKAFEAASALDEGYSRPYSGLSVAYLHQARLLGFVDTGDCYVQAFDLATLRRSLEYIDLAIDAAQENAETDEFINAVRAANEARVTYALCLVHLSGVPEVEATHCDRFERAADRITDDLDGDGIYDRTRLTPILPFAAMVEALRGMVAYFRGAESGDFAPATDAYTRAIALLERAPNAENRYQTMLDFNDRAEVWLTACALEEAVADFNRARGLATSLSLADAADYFAGMAAFAGDAQSNGCAP
jgi:tetratricopeptide (TPR) repeat protein